MSRVGQWFWQGAFQKRSMQMSGKWNGLFSWRGEGRQLRAGPCAWGWAGGEESPGQQSDHVAPGSAKKRSLVFKHKKKAWHLKQGRCKLLFINRSLWLNVEMGFLEPSPPYGSRKCTVEGIVAAQRGTGGMGESHRSEDTKAKSVHRVCFGGRANRLNLWGGRWKRKEGSL